MSLDIKRLKFFVNICERHSLTAAARASNVTQPVLSYHVAELEKSIGEPLLYRRVDGVDPTEAGLALLAHARLILEAVDIAEAEMRERRYRPGGTVAVGLLSSIAPMIAPRLIFECETRFPEISLKISEGTSLQLRKGITGNAFDIAVNLRENGDASKRSLFFEDLYFVASSGFIDLRRDTVTLAEALQHKLLLPPKGHIVRELIEEAARRGELSIRIEAEIEGLAMLKSLVSRSVGPSILGYSVIKAEHEAGTLIASKLVRPAIQREFILDEARSHRYPRAVGKIHTVLVNLVADLINIPKSY